jgi:chromosome segregation ATPase
MQVQVNSKREALDETARHVAEIETNRRAEVDALNLTIDTLREQLEKLQAWEQDAHAEISDLQKAVVDRDAEIDALSKRIKDTATQYEKQIATHSTLQERLDEAKREVAAKEAEVEQLTAKLADMTKEVTIVLNLFGFVWALIRISCQPAGIL